MPKWIVELEPGVYLADGDGDPPRTLAKTSALQFSSHPRACIARNKAREFRPFAQAKVMLAADGNYCSCGALSVDVCPLCHTAVCQNCAEAEGESCCTRPAEELPPNAMFSGAQEDV